jgi:WD40 repeat protein
MDNTARVWDTSGKLITELKHQDTVTSASFSPDGQRLVTTSRDNTLRVWDLSGRLLAELKPQNYVNSASFSPDGQRLVTEGFDGTVLLWRMDGLDQLLTRGCNWLKDYLASHPEEQKKLPVCQKR